jgi:hypothetical protein
MIGLKRAAPLAAALLLSALTAGSLLAQSRQATEGPEALEARAEAYLGDMEKWDDAAELYRRAAELRGPADLVSVANLKSAARLEFYQGSETRAQRDLEDAGEQALAMGDVVAAANAFVDAAWIAGTAGRGQEARTLAHRAQLLIHSPLITQADRSEIASRLPGER